MNTKTVPFGLALISLLTCGVLYAQTWVGRAPTAQETRNVAGLRNNLQSELSRQNDPVWHRAGVLRLDSTNGVYSTIYDTNGLILAATNSGNTVWLEFPNPTNAANRRWRVFTLGPTLAVFSNSCCEATTGFISATNVYAGTAQTVTYTLNSNRMAEVICTGTNFVVFQP